MIGKLKIAGFTQEVCWWERPQLGVSARFQNVKSRLGKGLNPDNGAKLLNAS